MKQKIQNKLRRAILAICTMMAMSVMTTAFSSCSSSDDDDEKVNIEEYLAGREWSIGSSDGTYSYYKNHMVLYEDSPGFTPGGLVSEPNIGFGYWQMTGDKLTTQFVLGLPAAFDISNLLNGTLSGLHLEKNNTLSGSGTSINIDQRPFIVGSFANGNKCRLSCVKKMDDISDATDHDMALRGTWYALVTDHATGKNHVASMTFNEDGTMHMVVEGLWDFTTTYITKNGKATINGYITEGNVVSLYYINSDRICIKFYNVKNGYMAAVLQKDRNAI